MCILYHLPQTWKELTKGCVSFTPPLHPSSLFTVFPSGNTGTATHSKWAKSWDDSYLAKQFSSAAHLKLYMDILWTYVDAWM